MGGEYPYRTEASTVAPTAQPAPPRDHDEPPELGEPYGASQATLAIPTVRPTAVSSAWRVIPAARPWLKETPWARKAMAIAALAIPMFPGVSGRRPETSRAGRMSRAATTGRWMPTAALIAVAPAKRPATEKATQPARRSAAAGCSPSARKASRRWAWLFRRPDGEDGAGGDEGGGDEQRPERHDAGDRAGDDEPAEDGPADDGDGRVRAAGRPQAALAGDEPGEEREPDGVTGAGGDERVHERAGAVARGRVRERRLPAAQADGGAPAAGRADEREREGDARRSRASAGRRARACRARARPASRGAGGSPPRRPAHTARAPLRRGCSC